MPKLSWLASLLVCLGCGRWTTMPTDHARLPFRTNGEVMSLEIAFVPLPPPVDQGESWEESLWKEVDEQSLSSQRRDEFLDNGFRLGVIGAQLPAKLQELLDAAQPVDATPPSGPRDEIARAETARALDQNLTVRVQRMHCRPGRRGLVVASRQIRDELALLTRAGTSVQGRTYRQAQCLFDLRAHPADDGRVRLELTPEVHHGQPRQRWVGEDGAFRLNAERDVQTFDHLRLEFPLASGQSLLIGPTTVRKGLGRAFFEDPGETPPQTHLLLVRLVGNEIDDRFVENPSNTALATPVDVP